MKYLLLAAMALPLIGCGGGSSSAPSESVEPTPEPVVEWVEVGRDYYRDELKITNQLMLDGEFVGSTYIESSIHNEFLIENANYQQTTAFDSSDYENQESIKVSYTATDSEWNEKAMFSVSRHHSDIPERSKYDNANFVKQARHADDSFEEIQMRLEVGSVDGYVELLFTVQTESDFTDMYCYSYDYVNDQGLTCDNSTFIPFETVQDLVSGIRNNVELEEYARTDWIYHIQKHIQ